ncbi:MAG: XRE family transcriptional regulator [Actinomycetota bacterium]|nr:XRE family transcriptional regulator [Actinomycetota bacterium]
MGKISRSRRAQIHARAQQVCQQGQLAGWSVERIAATILNDLPEVRPLEAWRLAYGWSRRRVIESIATCYRQAGLAVPAINSSMLCRWEHDQANPGIEYEQVLCRVYDARPDQLGLPTRSPVVLARGNPRRPSVPAPKVDKGDHSGSNVGVGALPAVRESIQLTLEIEGAGGGPVTRDHLGQAVQHYALNYAAFPPGQLGTEVHRCRAVVTSMLGHTQPDPARTELRRLGGWLSALLGNLAFHCADYTAANIHLSIAGRLGVDVGDPSLVAWAYAARSMLARYQQRPAEALDLARHAVKCADTPLRRAQVFAWAELPALAKLGRRSEAREAAGAAQREMDAAPESEQAGRFGFDPAELALHLAEAELVLGNAALAAAHAQTSLHHTTAGRPSWVAATLTLAGSEIQLRRPDQGAELALLVLDTVPVEILRETSRQRLTGLDGDLTALGRPGPAAVDLHERLRVVPPHNHDAAPRVEVRAPPCLGSPACRKGREAGNQDQSHTAVRTSKDEVASRPFYPGLEVS